MAKIIAFSNGHTIYVWKTVFHIVIDILQSEYPLDEDWVGQLEAYRGMACLFIDEKQCDSKILELFPITLLKMMKMGVPSEISKEQHGGYYIELQRIMSWFEERQKKCEGTSN